MTTTLQSQNNHSYSTGRSHCVVDDLIRTNSKWVRVNSGVPQGSFLGPLLLSLSIKGINDGLQYPKHIIFADDVQIYLSCPPSDLEKALTKVRHDINVIVNYFRLNELKSNLAKTKILILDSASYTNANDFSVLTIISFCETVIPYVSHVRTLEVILQLYLSWNMYVWSLSSRVYGTLHRLKHHKNSLPIELRS